MTGSNDVIATLSARVSELSKRVALLQAELEAAQKRAAIYEEHDSTIQEAVSGALRAAYTIRERAETTAAQILEQAREERRMLLKEIERLREERDALQEEIATRRRSGIAAVAPRPLSSDAAAAELRAVASEALRGLFQEIVEDIRSAPRPAAAPIAEEPRPVDTTPARAEPQAPPPVAATPAPAESVATPPAVVPPETAAPQPTYEHMTRMKQAAFTEEEDVAPVGQAGTEAPPPLEVVPPRVEVDEIAPARVEAATPTSDIQLVLSPIASFPRLVEIERHIQTLPVVRTLYVRDFRGGTATLTVALRSAMTAEEFAGMLAGLGQPRMRVVAGSRNTIELRIEGEASIA